MYARALECLQKVKALNGVPMADAVMPDQLLHFHIEAFDDQVQKNKFKNLDGSGGNMVSVKKEEPRDKPRERARRLSSKLTTNPFSAEEVPLRMNLININFEDIIEEYPGTPPGDSAPHESDLRFDMDQLLVVSPTVQSKRNRKKRLPGSLFNKYTSAKSESKPESRNPAFFNSNNRQLTALLITEVNDQEQDYLKMDPLKLKILSKTDV